MKRLVEEYLIDAAIPYTVLQPTMFMQNIDPMRALRTGVLSVPYSVDMPMSFVMQRDVAAVAVKTLGGEGHLRATYPLVGTAPTTFNEVAKIRAEGSGTPVVSKQVAAEVILASFPRETTEQRYTFDTFERMFSYYNRHGLTGNSNVLRWLLDRHPTGLSEHFKNALAAKV